MFFDAFAPALDVVKKGHLVVELHLAKTVGVAFFEDLPQGHLLLQQQSIGHVLLALQAAKVRLRQEGPDAFPRFLLPQVVPEGVGRKQCGGR